MFLCMRTTLNFDDDLIRAVKQRAADTGKTMTAWIEDALRETLAREQASRGDYKLHWRTVHGRILPGVDLTDRDALIDRMEERR